MSIMLKEMFKLLQESEILNRCLQLTENVVTFNLVRWDNGYNILLITDIDNTSSCVNDNML